MATLFSVISDVDTIIALEPEELAQPLLVYLQAAELDRAGSNNRHNLFHTDHYFREYPAEARHEVMDAFLAAWCWLEREGLILPKVGSGEGWIKVSKRGNQAASQAAFEAYRLGRMLPDGLLHPAIAFVKGSFLRGHYDTAVFEAFREVEIAVRRVGNFGDSDLGVPMMQEAFKPGGPLADGRAERGEQVAMMQLFAGAMGTFKNPTSHRRVVLSDPREAVEMLMCASYLLRVVDGRMQP